VIIAVTSFTQIILEATAYLEAPHMLLSYRFFSGTILSCLVASKTCMIAVKSQSGNWP